MIVSNIESQFYLDIYSVVSRSLLFYNYRGFSLEFLCFSITRL